MPDDADCNHWGMSYECETIPSPLCGSWYTGGPNELSCPPNTQEDVEYGTTEIPVTYHVGLIEAGPFGHFFFENSNVICSKTRDCHKDCEEAPDGSWGCKTDPNAQWNYSTQLYLYLFTESKIGVGDFEVIRSQFGDDGRSQDHN
jgi:hypothetical protein